MAAVEDRTRARRSSAAVFLWEEEEEDSPRGCEEREPLEDQPEGWPLHEEKPESALPRRNPRDRL